MIHENRTRKPVRFKSHDSVGSAKIHETPNKNCDHIQGLAYTGVFNLRSTGRLLLLKRRENFVLIIIPGFIINIVAFFTAFSGIMHVNFMLKSRHPDVVLEAINAWQHWN